MLSPTEFHEEYPSEKLAQKLPDRPVTSLRDLQFLYGKLYTLATAGGGEYAAYLTPDQASDLFGEEDSVIAVQVDLSGEEQRLDPDEPVFVTAYREELVGKVAHSDYDASAGIDHSVTHRSGRDSSKEKLARYATERLTRWATDEVVRGATADHEDGWIIESLAELGDDQAVLDRIESAVDAKLGGPRTALLTVRVKLDDGEYLWSGELDVFQAAMRARKLSKLVSKNAATDSAGDATDLVSGERARTVGMAEDPLNYFLGKQMEKFPGFDPDEAWRSHPISENAAVTLMNADTFVDACVYRAFGANVYYLPYYLGRTTPERAYQLYRILYQAATAADESMTPVEHAYDQLKEGGLDPRTENRLRFYVAAVQAHQTKRYDIFGDTMNGSILHPSELAAEHAELLDTWVFDPDDAPEGLRPAMPTSGEDWSLLARASPDEYRRTVSSGAYFYRTFRHGDEDTDATADDFRIVALVSALAGDPIPVERLLETYVARLREHDGDEFPSFLVASQFAQLGALARTGLLAASDGDEPLAEPPTYTEDMTNHTPTRARADGGQNASRARKRERKLESFIEETPALRENHERRAAYLLGALVGQVGGYQQGNEGRSTTLVDQYPIGSMTKTRLKRTVHEVLDKDVVYSRENRMASTMYAEIVDRLRDAFTRGDDPENWGIDTEDLRFYYALGVTYGLNNWTETDDSTEDAE